MTQLNDPFPILWAEDLADAVGAGRPRWLWQGDGHEGDPFRYGLAGRASSLLPPLPDLAPLENAVPLDGKSLKRAAKALAVLEELRRREAERDANRGEGHD